MQWIFTLSATVRLHEKLRDAREDQPGMAFVVRSAIYQNEGMILAIALLPVTLVVIMSS